MKKKLSLFAVLSAFLQLLSAQDIIQLAMPFSFHVDPMERLLLVNFENDPDTIYLGFEPQVFDDSVNGTGHLVIGWRIDGRVDVYHQKTLFPNPAKYDIAGKGIAHLVGCDMSAAFFEVNDKGVQASYAFTDIAGREIRLRINENQEARRKPFGLLAPMGVAATNPSSMPLILLQDFYFVRARQSAIHISIGGREHQHDILPMRIDRQKMTFVRYCPRPLILTLNPAYDGKLNLLDIARGAEEVRYENMSIKLEWKDEKAFIGSIVLQNEVYPVEMKFDKAFPNLNTMQEGEKRYSGFSIQGHPSTGVLKGVYAVEKHKGEVNVSFEFKGWRPRPDRFSLFVLYRMASVFRKWPSTYRWDANIHLRDGEACMQSAWERL